MQLNRQDLINLTGAKQRSTMLRQLRAQGIRHTTDRFGWPVVLRAEVESHLLSSASAGKLSRAVQAMKRVTNAKKEINARAA